MTVKRSSRVNLHDVLKDGSFNHAVVCTYTFDPTFFEEYALERFNPLSSAESITVLTDQSVYLDALNGQSNGLLRKANVRYLLHPVAATRLFHPKLYLFANERNGRLVIGSANFTRPGITANAELVGVFDYAEETEEDFLPLFQSSYAFLMELAIRSRSSALESNISAIGREAPWILEPVDSLIGPIRLLNNLTEPLWDQIVTGVDPPIDTIDVLSLFFDSNPSLIEKVFADLQPKKLRIFTENGRTTLTTSWLEHPQVQNCNTEILFVSYNDKRQSQPLHAKAMYLEKNGRGTLVYGSANFTSPALVRTADSGNSEVVVLVTDLDGTQVSIDRLFDPCGTAKPLKDEDHLITRPSEPRVPPPPPNLIHLREAEVVDDRINIILVVPETIRYDKLEAHLTFCNGSSAVLSVTHFKKADFRARLPQSLMRQLDSGSTVLSVAALNSDQEVASSNAVLVINLLESGAGGRPRSSRQVKEAQESVNQFFRVLAELLEGSDESALLVFFNMCDIPILETSRPLFLRPGRPQWDGGDGMRSLGKRNLQIYTELHPAAIAFFDRHFNKLLRHVEYGGVNGVSNFLHIFFAMGGVLRAQLERLLQGLEAQDAPIKPAVWAESRGHIDEYYYRARDLFICLDQEYLPKLARSSGWEEVREGFAHELKNLDELRFDFQFFRERLEEIRGKSLWIEGQLHQKIVPAYFSCIMDEESWGRFTSDIEDLKSIESELIA